MTVAFVLPGGASLGAIQVGMLRALFERGIRPDLVVGSSVGAINGAYLAGDPTPEGVDRLADLWLSVRRRDVFPIRPWQAVLGLTGRADHLVPNSALRSWLSGRLQFERLEDAAVPLRVLASDVDTGAPVVLSSGDVVTALLASTAMPGIFPPVPSGERFLMDGGIAADTPVAQAMEEGATTIYVLPTAVEAAVERRRAALDLLLQAVGHLVGRVTEAELAEVAGSCTTYLLPGPSTDDVSLFNFDATSRLIASSYERASGWLADPVPLAA
jgi:NTE family protein